MSLTPRSPSSLSCPPAAPPQSPGRQCPVAGHPSLSAAHTKARWQESPEPAPPLPQSPQLNEQNHLQTAIFHPETFQNSAQLPVKMSFHHSIMNDYSYVPTGNMQRYKHTHTHTSHMQTQTRTHMHTDTHAHMNMRRHTCTETHTHTCARTH